MSFAAESFAADDFDDPGSDHGPLTWGQEQVWAAMTATGSSLAMGGAVAVTDGRTVQDFVSELEFYLSRYPALRTRLRFGPDGEVTQVVSSAGEATLEIWDAEPDDPDRVAADLADRWREIVFDDENEWPIRMAVVRHNRAVTHVVVLVSHIATDGTGIITMVRDLQRRTSTQPPAARPLDLARLQRSPGMQRHTDAALRYWETHLRAVPVNRFDGPAHVDGPLFHRVIWTSTATHLAIRAIADRARSDTGTVLLAAFATVLTRVTGRGPFVAQTIVGNRFRPGLADIVSPVTQSGLCVLDIDGLDFDQAIRKARKASMAASKNAYYDPRAREDLFDRIATERGAPVDLQLLYNDRGVTDREPADESVPTAALIDAALSRTAVLHRAPMPFFSDKLMVNVEGVPGTVQITAEMDARYMPVDQLIAILGEVESVTTASAVAQTSTPAR